MKKTSTLLCLWGIVSLLSMVQAQDHLFISELTDPADDYTGRFVELYNAGAEAIDFSSLPVFLSRQSNGGTSWGEVQLSGTVQPGSTYVVGGSGFESIYGFAPDLVTGILTGNGDDAYVLFLNGDHTSGTVLDVFGVIDMDGTGEAWEYTDSRAVRLPAVILPNASWTAGEWELFPANIADGDPGYHVVSNNGDTTQSGGDFTVSVLHDTFDLGSPVELSILVSELSPADDIISYQFDLDYDTTVLQYVDHTLAGTLAEGGTAVVNSEVIGRLSIGYMNSIPLTGSGELVHLRFTSLRPDTSDILLSNVFLNNLSVDSVFNGTILIKETTPPSGRLEYSDTTNRYADTLQITAIFTEPLDSLQPVRIEMTGAVLLSELAMNRINDTMYNFLFPVPKATGDVFISFTGGNDRWGNAIIPQPSGGESFYIIPFVPGDVNDDGIVQAYDAALVLQYSVGIDPLPETDPMPWEAWRDSTANVDGAMGISAYDAGLILQYSTGIISAFPSGSGNTAPLANIRIEVEGNDLVFYASGELIGVNIRVVDEDKHLGIPVFLSEEYMSEYLDEEDLLSIGLCAASKAIDEEPILKIPFRKGGNLTFSIAANTQTYDLNVELPVTNEVAEGPSFKLYPNPVKNALKISGVEGQSTIRIMDSQGRMMREVKDFNSSMVLDVSVLKAGIYFIELEERGGNYVNKLVKR